MHSGRLGQRPFDPLVQPVDDRERFVGFLAGAEQDRLLAVRARRWKGRFSERVLIIVPV
jgi:hypothetical protein